ncbi:MAG: DNA polymerase III subunit gamma/tau [Ruminococcaceae bacterium]|nr:DNA polymerase III subunit gamma/tau [Oscillospiraceae bacterium]
MYQVLYRKWRPKTFDDVYGQPTVTAALRNELRTDRLAHAYLFTGSRGTGKTTCAKILAKAVNCLDLQDGNPCGECAICRGIDDGSILDVVEIDAASNNGVDNIRDLQEEAGFTPVSAKYRVYIIDEVHMLSAGAFNALLKTLEEPPEHVIFILATTEVHKLPATILSRCQRFDFGRIPAEDIAARLLDVARKESLTLTEEAAMLLARLADGALRDALSLMDQCLSRSEEITAEVVSQAVGLAGRDYLYELSAAVRGNDVATALTVLDRLYAASCDMERLCVEMIDFYRNLMILKSVKNAETLVIAASCELEHMREEAACYELPAVLHCMDALQNTLERLRGGASRRVEMEMALMRLATPALDVSNEALLRRIKALEDALRGGAAVAPTPAAPEPAAPTPAHEEVSPSAAPAPAAVAEDTAAEEPFTRWNEVMDDLRRNCMPLYGVLLGSSAIIKGDKVVICTDNELFRGLVTQEEHKQKLQAAVRNVTGRQYRFGLRRTATVQQEATDPLTAFLRESRERGVPVTEE